MAIEMIAQQDSSLHLMDETVSKDEYGKFREEKI
jgi:hypothetical protein